MAKITDLAVVQALGGDETLPMVQDGITRRVNFRGMAASMLPFLPAAFKGDPGGAGNVAANLVQLKAAPITSDTMLWGGVPFRWETEAAPYTADEDQPYITTVKSDHRPLAVGAWKRQTAKTISYAAPGSTRIRDTEAKLREIQTSIADYPGAPDMVATTDAALAVIGMTRPARLVVPRGDWSIGSDVDWSAYRNVTFVIESGASIANGSAAVVLPERVEIGLGASFSGSGSVTQKNRDEAPLQQPGGGHIRTGNVATGLGALSKNIGGYSNFAYGNNALAECKWGRSNFAWGNGVLSKVIGDQTGARATINSGEIISYNARGDASIGIGNTALRDMTEGCENLALGENTMQQLKTGLCNVALGANSQITGTDGNFNISVGCYTLVTNQGSNNLAIGWAALEGQTAGSNVAIGHAAMNQAKTGTRNTAVGILAFYSVTTGNDNVGVGLEVGRHITTGVNNTFLGSRAGGGVAGNSTNNTGVGANVFGPTDDLNGCTALGSGALNAVPGGTTNSTGIGISAQVTGSSQIQLGGPGQTTYANGAVQDRSDRRDKADIRDTRLGLDFILALRPVDFRWNRRDDYRDLSSAPRFDEEPPPSPRVLAPLAEDASDDDRVVYAAAAEQHRADTEQYAAEMEEYQQRLAEWRAAVYDPWVKANSLSNIQRGTKHKRIRFHHGLIAQEVKAAADALGQDFGGYQDHSINGGDDVLSLGYEELIAPLIKSIQQLTARLNALETVSTGAA